MNPDLLRAFEAWTPGSRRLYERACESLPYGNTRDPVWRDPYPVYMAHGDGASVVDVDGHRYLDWWNNATSLAVGHAHPVVVAAVRAAATTGFSFASPSLGEIELAERITARVPSAERVRFTNSGTEAVMLALQVARAATGRHLVVKFEGSYHGYYDPVAVSVTPTVDQAGARSTPSTTLEGTGVSARFAQDTLVLPWNDLEALEEAARRKGDEIAAVLIEPIANKAGVLVPPSGYLEGVRTIVDRIGAVLVFDEVISFRVGRGGAQERLGVTPDVTTLGKVIGGGLPVGAVAGTWRVMQHFKRGAPDGVGHMGTFNANALTTAAGCATLDLLTPDAYRHLEELGERARAGLREAIARSSLPWQVTGLGAMFKVHVHGRSIRNYRDTLPRPKARELELVTRLLLAGHTFPYNMADAATLPMTTADVDSLVEAFAGAAAAMTAGEAVADATTVPAAGRP